MPLYLAAEGNKDRLAAKVPFYIPYACFIQNFYTDYAARNIIGIYALAFGLTFGVVISPWILIVSIPLVIFSIAHAVFATRLGKKKWYYNDVGARYINTYLRLPKQLREDLKPLAKHADGCSPSSEDKRALDFWNLLDQYAEKYPPPEPVADPLDELIEKHKQTLKAWNDEL